MTVSSTVAIIVVAKLLHQRSESGYGDEGMPPSLASFAEQAAEMLGVTEKNVIDHASRRLYAQHLMASIRSGRYGETAAALKRAARDMGVNVETFKILADEDLVDRKRNP